MFEQVSVAAGEQLPSESELPAVDAQFEAQILQEVARRSPESALSQLFTLALQLAHEEQTRRHLAQPAEPLKSLKTIFAEYLFADPEQHPGNQAESEAIMELMQKSDEIHTLTTSLAESQFNEAVAREQANIDPLTGLVNRRGVQAVLEHLMQPAGPEKTAPEFTVVLLDLDKFKQVNDTRGHPFGDAVLQAFATLLQHHFRMNSGDVVGRWGGEEFIMVLNASVANVEPILQRLWARLQQPLLSDPEFSITASIGWAPYSPGQGQTPAELIAAADEALYAAKSGGRNQVVRFTPLAAELPGIPIAQPLSVLASVLT